MVLVEKILYFLDENHCVSINTIQILFGVSVTTEHKIIHEDRNRHKICAMFVPRMLSDVISINAVPCSPYNPDLAFCNSWLFPSKLKEDLRGSHLEDEDGCDKGLEHLLCGGLSWTSKPWLECCKKYIEVRGPHLKTTNTL